MLPEKRSQGRAARRAGWLFVLGMTAAQAISSAGPVTWTLTGVVGQGNQPVTGYFIFDADSLEVSDFNIAFAANFFVGHTFVYNPVDVPTPIVRNDVNGFSLTLDQLGGSSPSPPAPWAANFFLSTNTPLTDAGGTVAISAGAEYTNDQAGDSASILTGALVGVGSAPEPSTFGIAALGIGLFAIIRKRL